MTDQEYIRALFDLGYLSTVPEKDLDKLTIQDQDVIRASAKFQAFNESTMEVTVQMAHARCPILDGAVGPATIGAMQHRMSGCACPDIQAATGGSFPRGCHGKDHHNVNFGVDARRMPAEIKGERWERILGWVIAAYARRGIELNQIPVEEKTNFDIEFTHGRGWIGLAEFNSQSCDSHGFNKLDIGYCRTQNDVQIAELLCHEIGHNCNLQHVRQGRGVMGPVIRNLN